MHLCNSSLPASVCFFLSCLSSFLSPFLYFLFLSFLSFYMRLHKKKRFQKACWPITRVKKKKVVFIILIELADTFQPQDCRKEKEGRGWTPFLDLLSCKGNSHWNVLPPLHTLRGIFFIVPFPGTKNLHSKLPCIGRWGKRNTRDETTKMKNVKQEVVEREKIKEEKVEGGKC